MTNSNTQVWKLRALLPRKHDASIQDNAITNVLTVKYAPRSKHETINYGVARYGMEVRRLLSVMDNHLKDKTWFMGDDYTIVDMSLYPWVVTLGEKGYGADEFLQRVERFPNVNAWCERMKARPTVQRGMLVCGGPGAAEKLKLLMEEKAKSSL